MTLFKISASFVVMTIAAASLPAQERLAPITPDKQTEEQKKAAAQMKGPFPTNGPFSAFLRDPEVAVHAYQLATHFRTSTLLGTRLTEFAILLVARDWTQNFEWEAHYKRALDAGVKAETLKAIGEGRYPTTMADDEQIVYDFVSELNHNKGVSDPTYARALAKFGDNGVVSLSGLDGYYVMLAMMLNVTHTPVVNAANPPMPTLPR